MPLYPNKPAFLAEGVKPCPVSPEQSDCPICKEVLHSNENQAVSPHLANGNTIVSSTRHDKNTVTVTTITSIDVDGNNPTTEPIEDHRPIKICCCNNIFGRHCLQVWLKRRNDCPFCLAKLFPRDGPRDRLVAMVEATVGVAVRGAVDAYLDEVRRALEEDGDGDDFSSESGSESDEDEDEDENEGGSHTPDKSVGFICDSDSPDEDSSWSDGSEASGESDEFDGDSD